MKSTISASIGLSAIGLVLGAPVIHTSVKWSQDHHDVANTGMSPWKGPGKSLGVCKTTMIKSLEGYGFDVLTSKFYSSGVVAEDEEEWMVGDSDNHLWFTQENSDSTFSAKKMNLTAYFDIDDPVTNWGVVVSPATFLGPDGVSDFLYIASADGYLHAMNVDICDKDLRNGVHKNIKLLEVPVEKPLLSGLESSRPTLYNAFMTDESGDPVSLDNCSLWSNKNTDPWLNPPKILENVLRKGDNDEIVLAMSSSPILDTSSTLVAFNATTGESLWTWSPVQDGQTYGSVGIAPAVLPHKPIILVSAGPVVYGLNVSNGKECFTWQVPNNDKIVSSVAVEDFVGNPDPADPASEAGLYFHTQASTIWRLDFAGDCVNNNIVINSTWFCSYNSTSANCEASLKPLSATADPEAEAARMDLSDYAHPFYKTKHSMVNIPRFRSSGAFSHYTTHFPQDTHVAGGFRQPTTREDRDSLYESLRSLVLAQYGAEKLQSVEAAADAKSMALFNYYSQETSHAGESMDLIPLRSAALAALLDEFKIASIITSTGYTQLSSFGRPSQRHYPQRLGESQAEFAARARSPNPLWRHADALAAGLSKGDQPTGLYPYSTPAIGNFSIFVANFDPVFDSGLMAIDADTGALKWIFNTFIDANKTIPFGRSRSSPALDINNYVYVGADTDYDNDPSDNDTVPVLFAIDPTGKLSWATTLAEENVTVGAASPIITDGFNSEARMYMVAEDGVVTVTEGLDCPSSHPLFDCTGHGECNCKTGLCTCDTVCYGGGDCSKMNTTACVNGDCDENGSCNCNPCFLEDTTGACTVPFCNATDVCTVDTNGNPTCAPATCPVCEVMVNGACQPMDCGQGTCANNVCDCNNCWVHNPQDGQKCTQNAFCPNGSKCNEADGICDVCDACHTFDATAFDGEGGCVPNTNVCGPFGTCTASLINPSEAECSCPNACYPKDVVTGRCLSSPKNCGFGTCDPNAGACVCDSCYRHDSSGNCSASLMCGVGGKCNTFTNQCVCDFCYHKTDATGLCDLPNICNGHGICNPGANVCECNSCYHGQECKQLQNCSGNGVCMTDMNGHCDCLPGFGGDTCSGCDVCHAGPNCTDAVLSCSGHGTCVPDPEDATIPSCRCDDGFSGRSCATAIKKKGGVNVAAAVLVPLSLLAVAAGAIYYFAGKAGVTMGTYTLHLIQQGWSKVSGYSGWQKYSQLPKETGVSGKSAPKSWSSISSSSGVGSDSAMKAVDKLSALQSSDSSRVSKSSENIKIKSSRAGGYGAV